MEKAYRSETKGRIVFLCVAVLLTILLFCASEATAETYKATDIEKKMMVGQDEHLVAVYWMEGDVKKRAEIKSSNTEVTSSDPSVLKAELYHNTASYPSSHGIDLTALKPGVATLTIAINGVTVEEQIRVVGLEEAVIEEFPAGFTMGKGDRAPLERNNYEITCPDTRFYATVYPEGYRLISSNPKVVSVSKENREFYLRAESAGSATITMEITREDLQGITDSFVVTVVEGPRAPVPVLTKQVCAGYDSNTVGYKVAPGELEIEIYRSTKKTTGFKKVGSFDVVPETQGMQGYSTLDGNILLHYEHGEIWRFEDNSKKHRLKANTKYYYKARARYVDSYSSNEWSDYSDVQTYWTAPKPIANKKVKFKESTQRVKFPKVKKVSGYIYTASGIERLGYNIFRQPVYMMVEKTMTTKKRTFKVKKLQHGIRASDIEYVRPYAKHGKYYYADGYDLTKKLSKFKSAEEDKFAGRH